MLKDVVLGSRLPPVMLAMLGVKPNRLRTGVYDRCGYNFTNCIDGRGWAEWFDDETIPSYGVCDSIDQFFEKFGAAIDAHPLGHAVGFTEVRRADQPLKGGWRWHKWGEYFGTKEPKYEYLHDEPDIESVVTFSVIREAT